MKASKRKLCGALLCLTAGLMLLLTGCGDSGNKSSSTGSPDIEGLTYQDETKLDYADQFHIYNYKDGYKVIDIKDDAQYLIVPEGKDAPENTPEGMKVLNQPKKIYNAATSSMALFAAMDGMDSVAMCSLDKSGWSFDAPKKALESGKMKFAGKYSEPDYEMLTAEQCDLAIESTMIYHSPDVKEMIEDLGIPVMVDHSSYESNPLGRTEWIKLYGALTGHEKEAEAFFDKQKKLSDLKQAENTGKTVAFFYISTDHKAVVKSKTDYVASMIELAGGKYAFDEVINETKSNSVPMSIEKFYSIAKDADIIVYNGSIDSSVKSLSSFLAKDPVMKDLRAVKEGNVWQTSGSMYQRTDTVGEMIQDFHTLVSEDKPSGMTFISRLQ